jgi:AbrB family looped-hinge helix DNA binding protein
MYHVLMEKRLGFVAVQPRNGTVTIPAEARRTLGLDHPGAQVEVIIRDGEIVLIPHMAVPTDQAWFFSAGHQAAEREADADLAAGRYRDFDDADALLDHLESVAAGDE